MVVRIQLRHDTAENWRTNNPTLYVGEVGVEIDTKKIKVGDGNTQYNNLDYVIGDSLPEFRGVGNVLTHDGLKPVWDYIIEKNDIINNVKKPLSKLVLNILTQEDYNQMLENGEINDDEIYLPQSSTYSKDEIDNMLSKISVAQFLNDEQYEILEKDGIYNDTIVPNETVFTTNDGKFVQYINKSYQWENGIIPYKMLVEDMTFGNGRFVVCGQNDEYVFSSTDGENWEKYELPSRSYNKSISYGNGKFLIAPWGGTWFVSNDGITWSEYESFQKTGISGLRWCYDRFIATTESEKIYWSTDGETWNEGTLPNNTSWQYPCYGNGLYVVGAYSSDVCAVSTDMINWTTYVMPSFANAHIVYGNGVFVSSSGYYSVDCRAWKEIQSTIRSFTHLIYDGRKFIGNSNSYYAYSYDGITWFEIENPQKYTVGAMACGNGKIVVVEYNSFETELKIGYINDNIVEKGIKSLSYTKTETDELLKNYAPSDANLPNIEDKNGCVLTTDGQSVSWDKIIHVNNISTNTVEKPSKFVINKLTKQDYDSLVENNNINDNELYAITDVDDNYVLKSEFQSLEAEINKKANVDDVNASITTIESNVILKADKEDTYTKTEVDELLENIEQNISSDIPLQTNNAGKFLTTDGTDALWDYVIRFNDVENISEKGISKLIINKLTQSKYNELLESNQIKDDELYITDEVLYPTSVFDDNKQACITVSVGENDLVVMQSGQNIEYGNGIKSGTITFNKEYMDTDYSITSSIMSTNDILENIKITSKTTMGFGWKYVNNAEDNTEYSGSFDWNVVGRCNK